MTSISVRARTLAALCLAGAALAPTLVAAQTDVIYAGRVLIRADQPLTGPQTITVADGRIVAMAPGRQAPPAGARVHDLSDRTVLPGLVDLHVHLQSDPGGDYRQDAVETEATGTIRAVRNAGITLAAGFTTVRDAGSGPEALFALRSAAADGTIVAPRIIASGPAISIIGGHGDVSGFRREVLDALATGYTCTGPVECSAMVRKAARAGSDTIKITATGGVLSQQARGLEAHFSGEEMRAIVTTAGQLGLDVMAHAHGARGIEAAAAAGVHTIEHGTFADEAALRVMAREGTYLIPTLMALDGVRKGLGTGRYTPAVEEKIKVTVARAGKAIGLAKQLGVPVAFGTDAGVFPHGTNGGEFALMVRAGMTPREALASATTTAARVLGLEGEIGEIAPGRAADLIAVAGDPTSDVATLERVSWVMARGRVAPASTPAPPAATAR